MEPLIPQPNQSGVLTKLEHRSGGDWVPHQYDNTFCRETLSDGSMRLRIGPRDRHADLLLDLAADLDEPFRILYVLHTPRGGSSHGRYESPDLDRASAVEVFTQFGEFFATDARHDVWLYSPPDDAMLVWDRHDLIYAYGPLDAFVDVLNAAGFLLAEDVPIPSPHAHRYYEEFDSAERQLVSLGWTATPLRQSDEQ